MQEKVRSKEPKLMPRAVAATVPEGQKKTEAY
jgi:hypothetical protein